MRIWKYAFLGIVLLSGGCAGPFVRQVETPVIPTPLVERIPLTIGVHFTSQFRSAQPVSRNHVRGADVFEEMWQIGGPSVALIKTVLRGLFKSVVEVPQWPADDTVPPVVGVLVPSLPTGAVDAWGTQYEVRYHLELYSKQGERLAAWEVVGVSSTTQGEIVFVTGMTMVRDAMRSAAAGIVLSFFRQPELRAWLESNGVVPDSLR